MRVTVPSAATSIPVAQRPLAGNSLASPRPERTQYSQQLLKCPLLVDFIGAVADVRIEVVRGMFFHYVTDVGN